MFLLVVWLEGASSGLSDVPARLDERVGASVRRPSVRSGRGVTARWTSASAPSIRNASAVIVRLPAITPAVPYVGSLTMMSPSPPPPAKVASVAVATT